MCLSQRKDPEVIWPSFLLLQIGKLRLRRMLRPEFDPRSFGGVAMTDAHSH